MHRTAVNFALKHRINLGRDVASGLYYIVDRCTDPDQVTCIFGQRVVDVSNFPTAKSAIAMIKRHLRRNHA